MPREASVLITNARTHLEQGIADEALLEAEEALASSKEKGDVQGFRDALSLVCKAHLALGRPANASTTVVKELVNASKRDDKRFEVAVLLTHSEVLLANNSPEESVSKAIQCAEKAAALDDKTWQYAALQVEADALLTIGSLSDAKVAAEELTVVASMLQDLTKEAGAFQKLATVNHRLGENIEAIRAANKAFSKYQMASDRAGQANLLELQARINLWGLDRPEEARRLAQASVALARETGDAAIVDVALATLIHVYIVQDKKSEALRIAQQELSKVRSGAVKGRESAAWERLMSTFFEMGDDNAARKSCQDGLASCAKVGEAEAAAMAMAAAKLYMRLGMGDDALSQAQQAWTSYKRLGDSTGLATAVQVLTAVKLARGEVPPKSVARELALAQLKELAKAVQTRSLKSFTACMERLTALGSISQQDIDAVLVPIFAEDKEGTMEMIEAYAEVARPQQGAALIAERLQELLAGEKQKDEALQSSSERLLTVDKRGVYFMHFVGGMGFGPRFQVCQQSYVRMKKENPVVFSASRIEHPEGDPHDWEGGLLLHPGMIDSAIHNGVLFTINDAVRDQIKLKNAVA
mmetsp:Transcript_42865/g.100541  ORF Transcript_42865/g.100541 Transcript_42865/m.100541 type:complete len:583 (+) Transcript_42865:128-1876(+)